MSDMERGFTSEVAAIFTVSGIRNQCVCVIPLTSDRPIPTEVPPDLAADYSEAALTLPLSPKASAALSRRCLQNTIREHGITRRDLNAEIDEVINSHSVSSHLADNLHAVRVLGNFAAHPLKSTNTGDIIEVEPDEAQWNLEVLDGLFDEWYVQPVKNAARKAALNPSRLKRENLRFRSKIQTAQDPSGDPTTGEDSRRSLCPSSLRREPPTRLTSLRGPNRRDRACRRFIEYRETDRWCTWATELYGRSKCFGARTEGRTV